MPDMQRLCGLEPDRVFPMVGHSGETPAAVPAIISHRTYFTLDGMRGIAALLIVIRHSFGAFAPINFPSSFLAVDLFYILSGFVIASAYERRLAGGTLTKLAFIRVRITRLWPLYALSTFAGLVALYSKATPANLDAYWLSTSFSILMLPNLGSQMLYPANFVAWSLGYELLINTVYVVSFRWLHTRVLIAVTALAAAAVVVAAFSSAGLNSGFEWRTTWVGLARVCFSFPFGIILFRYRSSIALVKLPTLMVLCVLLILLTCSPAVLIEPSYQILVILIGFPLLVATAIQIEPPRHLVPVMSFLGVTSYAVYMLHPPLIILIAWAMRKVGIDYYTSGPWSGLAAIALIYPAAWVADIAYDKPIRTWLIRLAMPQNRAPSSN